MGEPAFRLRPLIERHGIARFPSNYMLYGDMSRRVKTLERFSPEIELYSIDKTFLNLSGFAQGSVGGGRRSRTVKRGPASRPASASARPRRWRSWRTRSQRRTRSSAGFAICRTRPCAKPCCAPSRSLTCGALGRASARKLAGAGVTTAAGLRDIEPKQARQLGTVVLERIVHELRGLPCLELEIAAPARKGMAVTRSFGQAMTERARVLEAAAMYATRAGEKLRAHGLVAGQLTR